MKQGITIKPCHARSVRLLLSTIIFTLLRGSFSPSILLLLISPNLVTLSDRIGSERDAIFIVRVVVVIATIVIDISEIVGVVSRPQPPIRATTTTTENNP